MPNNTLIGALRVEATLDGGKFIDGARKIRAEATKTQASLKSSFNAAEASVKGFTGALAAGLSIGLLGGLATKALNFAAAIGTTAKQLGVTTKELQTFRYAADQVGIKNADAERGIQQLGITLGKAAAGSKTASAALASVGVSLNDIKTKSRIEIFGQIADGMQRTGGAAKSAAAANAIFGESASKLTPLLDQGSEGINQLSGAAERLGIVLSDQQIQSADETARKLEDVKTVLAAQIAGVVADNAGSILSLANSLGRLTSAIVNFLGSNPQAALGILGALVGGRVGGLPGAALGGLAGLAAGNELARANAASNLDPRFRAAEIRKALKNYRQAKAVGSYELVAITRKELEKQIALGQKVSSAKPATVAFGGGDIPQFLATGGGGRKSRVPRSSSGPRDRSDDVRFQFDQEQRRAEMDILRAKQSVAHDYVERTSLSIQMLDLEKQSFEAELADRVRRAERDFAEGKITAAALEEVKAQAGQLKASNDIADSLKRQAILEEEQEQRQEDVEKLAQGDLDRQRQVLESHGAIATTASERRKIELELLRIAYEQKRQALQHILDTSKDDTEIESARRDLQTLDQTYGTDRQGVINSTRGPLEDWAASIPQSAAQINEAFQSIEVEGLNGLSDAITAVITGTQSLQEAFSQLAQSIIADIIKMTIKMLIFRAISGLFGGGGTDFGALFANENAIPAEVNIPRFATGGGFNILGNRGTDNNMLSLNGVPIARVSHGERINIGAANDGGMQVVVNQSNNFAGGAVTKTDLLQMHAVTVAAAKKAVNEQARRR